MRNVRRPILCSCVAILMSMAVGACGAFGAGRVPADRFDYSEALLQSSEEQMLANVVRIRYLRVPMFLEVSSVLTQYTYEGGAGIFAQRGFGAESDVVGGAANLSYSERPTITYLPLSGSDFSARMLSPISVELLFSAALAGWPVDTLFLATLQQINNVENMSFGEVPSPGDTGSSYQFEEDLEKFRRFEQLLNLMFELVRLDALELQRFEEKGPIYLVLVPTASPKAERSVSEFKRTLELDPKINRFLVTDRETKRGPDEITIRSRSVMGAMTFLARGVEVPQEHIDQGYVIPMRVSADDKARRLPLPLTVISRSIDAGRSRPPDAFVAVRYEDYWFYISRSDILSKRAFADLLMLYSIQAPASERAAPVLTLPTG